MNVQIANALITGAPLDDDTLIAAQEHYRVLADMLFDSGPKFGLARRDAVEFHNKCVRRRRESSEEAARRAAQLAAHEADLVEIEA